MTTRAERFFTEDCVFAFGAGVASALPPPHLPEFVFTGRSNAGKSSLLNALVGQKAMAHVSTTPGRTQQLNFFCVSRRCYVVDVPGYGFAKAPKGKVAAWQGLLRHYLRARTVLRRIFVLIDARHGITGTDEEFLKELDRAAQLYQIILTKADLVPEAERESVADAVRLALTKHPAACPDLLLTSAVKREGIEGLRRVMFDLVNGG